MRDLGIGEEGEGNLSAGGDAVATGEVVAEDAEIVQRNVCELRAPGDFAIGPNPGGCGLELSFTLMKPLSVSSTPARSSPILSVLGVRPVATRMCVASMVFFAPCCM